MTFSYQRFDRVLPPLLPSWHLLLHQIIESSQFEQLRSNIAAEASAGTIIYPAMEQVFASLNACPLSKVKVVILGQDPYHGPGQAHGFCFSVAPGVVAPPSLKNIFKEIAQEFNTNVPNSGDLRPWAEQGVLLLNTCLTVRAKQAGSHQGIGWEAFTDAVIKEINRSCKHVVFLLWGKPAQAKKTHIDMRKHLVLTSAHPSPLSAHRGFMGCGHFQKANAYLKQHGRLPIEWTTLVKAGACP